MRLRDDYIADCAKGVERWNKVIEQAGVDFTLALPHVAFHRADRRVHATSRRRRDGELIDDGAWSKRKATNGCRRRPTATSSPA